MSAEFPIDDMPEEDVLLIDIAALNTDSEHEAENMIRIVTDLYHDETFKSRHPQAQHRIEMELETLRGLIKMRKADEEAHDALLQAIASNKTNASLYRGLAEIQKTSIALSNKIHDTIDRLNNICKGFQLELDFDAPKPEDEPQMASGVHRGSKTFIKDMLESQKQSELPLD